MNLPASSFDAENAFLCTKCEAMLDKGIQKARVISGSHNPRFPIHTGGAVQIVKNARNLDIEMAFEEKAGR